MSSCQNELKLSTELTWVKSNTPAKFQAEQAVDEMGGKQMAGKSLLKLLGRYTQKQQFKQKLAQTLGE